MISNAIVHLERPRSKKKNLNYTYVVNDNYRSISDDWILIEN